MKNPKKSYTKWVRALAALEVLETKLIENLERKAEKTQIRLDEVINIQQNREWNRKAAEEQNLEKPYISRKRAPKYEKGSPEYTALQKQRREKIAVTMKNKLNAMTPDERQAWDTRKTREVKKPLGGALAILLFMQPGALYYCKDFKPCCHRWETQISRLVKRGLAEIVTDAPPDVVVWAAGTVREKSYTRTGTRYRITQDGIDYREKIEWPGRG